jgi:hypothetical protein
MNGVLIFLYRRLKSKNYLLHYFCVVVVAWLAVLLTGGTTAGAVLEVVPLFTPEVGCCGMAAGCFLEPFFFIAELLTLADEPLRCDNLIFSYLVPA